MQKESELFIEKFEQRIAVATKEKVRIVIKEQYKEALRIIEEVSSNLADEKIRNIFLHSDPITRIRNSFDKIH